MKRLLLLWVLALSVSAAHAQDALPKLGERLQRYQEENQGKFEALAPKDQEIIKKYKENLLREMANAGLKVGEKAPDFTLPNAFGKPVNLYQQLKQGPVILAFYRGAWCPFCNLQLRAYQHALPVFQRYQANLITITPQLPDQSIQQVKKTPLTFEVLSDLDSAVMKTYQLFFEVPRDLHEVYKAMEIVNLEEFNGQGRIELPVPGTFIIDQQGIIRAAFADPDWTKRMEPIDIVLALAKIRKKLGTGKP